MTGTGLAQTWYVMNEVLAPCGLSISEKGLKNTCQTPPATCFYHKYTWKSFQILRSDDFACLIVHLHCFCSSCPMGYRNSFLVYTSNNQMNINSALLYSTLIGERKSASGIQCKPKNIASKKRKTMHWYKMQESYYRAKKKKKNSTPLRNTNRHQIINKLKLTIIWLCV